MEEPSSSSTRSREYRRSASLFAQNPIDSANGNLWLHELQYAAQGFTSIAGIDEAGRGPLAGPVVAACVILPLNFKGVGIDDSKRLSAKQREEAFVRVVSESLAFSHGVVESDEIDQINILRATHLAMQRAVSAIALQPDLLLIDGLPVPNMAECPHIAIVGGDALSITIAAASIVAKVTRDRVMCAHSATYPEYGFDKHKGYGSAFHLQALRIHGPCPIHRKSFSPIAALTHPVLL